MVPRFEINVQTQEQEEILQKIYRRQDGDVVVRDYGVSAPEGYEEYTGDMKDLYPPEEPE